MKRISVKTIVVLLVAITTLSGCGKSSKLQGSWRLEKFCYGADCINMRDFGFDQVWTLDDNPAPDSCCFTENACFTGHQHQIDVMNQEIAWSINGQGDTLYIKKLPDGGIDTQMVNHLTNDTLILSSMLNNILICQHFVRQ
ncbi:MAG: lipocalin family protein [Bacteroidales bacterium]|nr:lipocalin family protein [Bacteroidales bacterium]